MRKMLAALAFATTLLSGAADAGTLVVGGDTTPTFSLNAFDAGNTGNRAFYDNVRGAATRVVISERSFSPPGFPSFANANLANFYRETAGVDVVQTAGDITTDILAGTGLLVLQFRNDAFAGDEMMAIERYVRSGGSLLLVGEASIINSTLPAPAFTEGSQANAIANGLLAGIGSSIRLNDDTIGIVAPTVATGAAIASDPLTAGVTSFRYGAATSVSGGKALFFAPDASGTLKPFFATEMLDAIAVVPEPTTWAMMIVGVGLVGGATRRRRSAPALA